MLSLRLFGGFALLESDGRSVRSLAQRRPEAVLALLALAGDVGCSRDRLVGLLWPEADDEHARHNLRSALHAIRAVAGADAIITNGDHVRLNDAVVSCDAAQFTRACAAGRREEAVAVYRGALLDGFHVDGAPDFERFIEEERARLYRQCAEAIETIARGASVVSGPQGGASWWMRAAEHDPHNSRIALHLMRALVAAGDPANALMHAEHHRRRLWEDLEIEPDERFDAEIRRIRQLCERGAAK